MSFKKRLKNLARYVRNIMHNVRHIVLSVISIGSYVYYAETARSFQKHVFSESLTIQTVSPDIHYRNNTL